MLTAKLVLVGCGHMGGPLLEGWLERGVEARHVTVVEPDADIGAALAQDHGITVHSGPETIAAETEVIELLLQAKRCCCKGGGGGAGSSPGGGGGGDTDDSALARLGEGDADNTRAEARFVSQSTGVAGGELPIEFRTGLDAYFATLESSDAALGESQ